MGALVPAGWHGPGCLCRHCRTARAWAARTHRRRVLTGIKLAVTVPVVAWLAALVAQPDDASTSVQTKTPGRRPAAPARRGRATATTLLRLADQGRLRLPAQARADLAAGRIDARLIRLLVELADEHRLTISVLRSGHTKYVAGDPNRQISQHFYGQAVDISALDGRPVRANHPGARQLVLALAARPLGRRPTEIGHPFHLAVNARGGIWTDPAHHDHLHLGVRGMPT